MAQPKLRCVERYYVKQLAVVMACLGIIMYATRARCWGCELEEEGCEVHVEPASCRSRSLACRAEGARLKAVRRRKRR
ncbi:MAG: hypothetical protein ACKPKO_43045, partial [Candidatus Fonsibacter sp.]